MSPDEFAELEEERRFLLRSLTDLEREHEAGDVDEADYAILRDGYTARAAGVLRAIEEGRRALPPPRTRPLWQTAAVVAGVLVLAVGAGWLVASSSGQRLSGQTMTGGIGGDGDVPFKLSEARAVLGSDPFRAAQLYQEVLDVDPGHAEARTYLAWLLALSASGAGAEASAIALADATRTFETVIAANPEYADAHCLYAVTAARLLAEPDLELAREQGEQCLANDPPGEMRSLIESFVDNL